MAQKTLQNLKKVLEDQLLPLKLGGLTASPSDLIDIGMRRDNLIIAITDELVALVMKEARMKLNTRVQLKSPPLRNEDYCDNSRQLLSQLRRASSLHAILVFNPIRGTFSNPIDFMVTTSSIVCGAPEEWKLEIFKAMRHQDIPEHDGPKKGVLPKAKPRRNKKDVG